MALDLGKVLVVLSLFATVIVTGEDAGDGARSEERLVFSGRLESCSGCQLNRLPEVKAFVTHDLPLYHNIPFKHIGGADPDLLLLDKEGSIIKRIGLKTFKRAEINDLFGSLGFYKKGSSDEEVPEEFLEGPYLPKETKEEEEEPAEDTEEQKDEL
uniref:Selenoprotein M n=1 Tax=Patiria miniata TaxID=46514 RepID=A0A914A7R0_PATMI